METLNLSNTKKHNIKLNNKIKKNKEDTQIDNNQTNSNVLNNKYYDYWYINFILNISQCMLRLASLIFRIYTWYRYTKMYKAVYDNYKNKY